MIFYNTLDVKMPLIPKRKISRWIKLTAAKFNKRVGEISYIFCSDEKIISINKQYLNHNYYTDIITFDYTNKQIISADIFISVDTVRTNSEKYKTEYINELYRVIIHGILHLCELNDKNQEESKIMEDNENMALNVLKEILTEDNTNLYIDNK